MVTLTEAKSQLRVDHTAEDVLITRLIAMSVGYLDGRDGILGRCLISQTWQQTLDGFPDASQIRLGLNPVQSITSVKYTDAAGLEQTMNAGDYYILKHRGVAYAILAPSASWPSTDTTGGSVRIEFVAGYGDETTDIPETLRHAVLLHLTENYDNRSAIITGTIVAVLPLGFSALIAPYIMRSP